MDNKAPLIADSGVTSHENSVERINQRLGNIENYLAEMTRLKQAEVNKQQTSAAEQYYQQKKRYKRFQI